MRLAVLYRVKVLCSASISDVNNPLPVLPLNAIELDEAFSWSNEDLPYRSMNAWDSVRYTWTLLVPEH